MSQPSRPLPKKSIQGTRKPKKRRNLTILLVVCVVVAGGILGYKHIQKDRAIAKERAQYNSAEANLNNLADEIVAKFGRPADRKELKACGYTSQEFGRGALYCNVDVGILYGTSTLDSSIELAKAIEANGLKGGKIKQEYDPTISSDSTPPVDIFFEDYTNSGLDCSIGYSYYPSDEVVIPLGFTKSSFGSAGQALLIDMNCNARSPKAAYYPVQNPK